MDFFERAHIPKKKDTKSEEKVKKQLKQMLYGYKKSDNEMIKNVADEVSEFSDPTRCLDDSASVSGFSDLILTDSSNEVENTQDTIGSQDISSDALNELESNDDKMKYDPETDSELADYNDDMQSLSEDLTDITEGSEFDDSDTPLSISLAETTSTNDSDSADFDPDGKLADKILTKLHEKGNSMKEKVQKRKIENIVKLEPEIKLEKNSKKKTKKCRSTKNVEEKNTISDREEKESILETVKESQLGRSSDDIIDTKSVEASTPFVSISVSDMPDQSLNDILGDYRHPTVKNLPSDKQNVIYSGHYSGTFEAEDISLQTAQIEEEADSLVPELDEDPTDEDFVSDTDFNVSIEPVEESTEVYDTIESDNSSIKETVSKPYSNPIKVYFGKKCCVFVLKHPTELYIHGKVKVCALGGTVEVLGYTLNEKLNEIYAPYCSYAQCFKTVEAPNTYYGLFSKLSTSGLSVPESESIVTSIGPYDGVICMYSLKSPVMDFVNTQFKATDLFSKQNKHVDTSLKKVSEFLGCSLYRSKPNRYFEELSFWENAVDYGLKDQGRSCGIVCGGKDTGKSTFLRYYVNRLLSNGPVLVIDLDPGQAEFTPAGNVSATLVTEPLLGPNFTHLKSPELTFHIAMINIMDNPQLYMAGIYKLFMHLNTDFRYKGYPWIVNTMGLCNSMGFRIISAIILLFRPTFVLQIHSKNIKKRFQHKLYPELLQSFFDNDFKHDYIFGDVPWPENLDYKLIIGGHEVSNNKTATVSSRDERYLNFLAHFGALTAQHNGDILSIVPYEVSLKDLVVHTNVQCPRDAIDKVINGKIVALCQLDTSRGKENSHKMGHPMPIPCYGYGLVRGVDMEKGLVYIVTGVALDKLSLVNCAVYSDWAPELRVGDTLAAGTSLPYRTANPYDQRQLMFSPRRRFNPIQLLKMSRSA